MVTGNRYPIQRRHLEHSLAGMVVDIEVPIWPLHCDGVYLERVIGYLNTREDENPQFLAARRSLDSVTMVVRCVDL